MKPYKIVTVEPGMARIVDRKTGQPVGYVLTTNIGWQGFLDGQYEPVTITTIPVEKPLRHALGATQEIKNARYRTTAAAKVWAAHTTNTHLEGA